MSIGEAAFGFRAVCIVKAAEIVEDWLTSAGCVIGVAEESFPTNARGTVVDGLTAGIWRTLVR